MSLARDVTTVGSATLLSGLIGFFRAVGIAAVLGAGALGAGMLSDASFAALQIPNLFRRLLAEGALNSAYVPVWLRIKKESGERGARRFGEQVLGAMALSLGLIALVCIPGNLCGRMNSHVQSLSAELMDAPAAGITPPSSTKENTHRSRCQALSSSVG